MVTTLAEGYGSSDSEHADGRTHAEPVYHVRELEADVWEPWFGDTDPRMGESTPQPLPAGKTWGGGTEEEREGPRELRHPAICRAADCKSLPDRDLSVLCFCPSCYSLCLRH